MIIEDELLQRFSRFTDAELTAQVTWFPTHTKVVSGNIAGLRFILSIDPDKHAQLSFSGFKGPSKKRVVMGQVEKALKLVNISPRTPVMIRNNTAHMVIRGAGS